MSWQCPYILNHNYFTTDFHVQCAWYTGLDRPRRTGLTWLHYCLGIISFTEMSLVKCLGHWKSRKAGIPHPAHIQTSKSGSGSPILWCIPQTHSPCRKRWRLLVVFILALRGSLRLSSYLKHSSSAIVNCLRSSGFRRTAPVYSKWKLRWVLMLFTKEKENRDQVADTWLTKWQTLQSDNA